MDQRTQDHQQPHCDHEEICRFFMHDSKIAVHDGTPCMRNHQGCVKCTYDSRAIGSSPAPGPEKWIVIFEMDDYDPAIHEYDNEKEAREDWKDNKEYRLGHKCIAIVVEDEEAIRFHPHIPAPDIIPMTKISLQAFKGEVAKDAR